MNGYYLFLCAAIMIVVLGFALYFPDTQRARAVFRSVVYLAIVAFVAGAGGTYFFGLAPDLFNSPVLEKADRRPVRGRPDAVPATIPDLEKAETDWQSVLRPQATVYPKKREALRQEAKRTGGAASGSRTKLVRSVRTINVAPDGTIVPGDSASTLSADPVTMAVQAPRAPESASGFASEEIATTPPHAGAMPVAADQSAISVAQDSPADIPEGRGGPFQAMRVFAGPRQYPPSDFAAYGIVAFKYRATEADIDRHGMFCRAYTAVLPESASQTFPPEEQMVTVWPVDSDVYAAAMNGMPKVDICDAAIKRYGFTSSSKAVIAAKLAGVDVTGRGPFLFAWSASSTTGGKDAPILVSDLSNVESYGEALDVLRAWTVDIEGDPNLWADGWNVEKLTSKTRHWVDRFGPNIISLAGLEN